jgi:hypothetical protein
VFWVTTWLVAAAAGMATAETPMPPHEARWRAPLSRADAALAEGHAREAERAWQEAQRAAMWPGIPASGLVNVGLAYIRIGEAAHDRQTAVSRARQLFLRAMFRARDRRDVDGLTEVSRAFASLGDCEMSGRVFAVALTMKPKPEGPAPACERSDPARQPSASPPSGTAVPDPWGR